MVLVAEDSEDTLHVLSLELRHRGCRMIKAADGRETVERALTAHPDLILMDLTLPRMDGLAATEEIRAHSEMDSVPIIAVTAFDRADAAGCDHYFSKPIDCYRLRVLVEGLTKAARGGGTGEKRSSAPRHDVMP